MKRFRADPFFAINPDERNADITERRSRRLETLQVQAVGHNRALVLNAGGIKSGAPRYYYLDRPNGQARCFCLDASKGNDKCKHVLAVDIFDGDTSVAEVVGNHGGQTYIRSIQGASPVLTRGIGTAKKMMERKTWDWTSTAHASWVLTHPKADEACWEMLATQADSPMALLGLLRLGTPSSAVVDILVGRTDLDGELHATVCGRLLATGVDRAMVAKIWKPVRERWSGNNDILLASVLRAAGRLVALAIPKSDLTDLFQSSDANVRGAMMGTLRSVKESVPRVAL